MNLRITLLVTIIAGVFIQVASGNELDFDSPDGALRHDMLILDADVRNSALAGYKRRFNLSDDELSARLVKLALVTTNGEEATLRMFTVAALGDFGTTNALDFLENEALRGGDISGGVDGFGKITKFDGRFFALAEKILSDKSRPNRYRRSAVYNVYRELLTSNQPFWMPISQEVRDAAKTSLLRAALDEDAYSASVDDILMHSLDNYANNPQRLQIAQRIVQMRDLSDYTHNYFKTVLEQMGKEDLPNELEAISNVASKTTAQQLQAEPSDCSTHKELTEKNATPSFPPTSARQHCSMAFFIMRAFLVFGMALAIVIFLRKRK